MMFSKSFVVGTTAVSEILMEVVHAINLELRREIEWTKGNKMIESMQAFEQ